MTVLMTSDMPGTTQENYEHMAAALGPVMRTSSGFIAHAAGPTDSGFRVTEIWESEAAHQAWFEAHVAPAIPAGAPAPTVTFQEIVNIVTP